MLKCWAGGYSCQVSWSSHEIITVEMHGFLTTSLRYFFVESFLSFLHLKWLQSCFNGPCMLFGP